MGGFFYLCSPSFGDFSWGFFELFISIESRYLDAIVEGFLVGSSNEFYGLFDFQVRARDENLEADLVLEFIFDLHLLIVV